MSQFAIQAEGLGKKYRIARGRLRGQVMLRQELSDAMKSGVRAVWRSLGREAPDPRGPATRDFWALREVSFQLRPGESIGIIGRNGAGKSTLLKLLARVTTPSTGRARLRGRVGSLLEVGTGFHSELTGRENIYLNGAVLGMRRREIEAKFDEIVDFSGVGEFLETPVKFFSNGMRMRLAFSVAAHLEPEILLVDEVLAVGDAAFQQKCLSKMGDVVGHGRTVLFVSHNMPAVRALCQSALYIDEGRVRFAGEVNAAIDAYVGQAGDQRTGPIEFDAMPEREVRILSVALEDEHGAAATSIPHDRPFRAHVRVRVHVPVYRAHLVLHILDAELATVTTVRDIDDLEVSPMAVSAGIHAYRVRFSAPSLVPGKYWLRLQVLRQGRYITESMDETKAIWPFEVYDNGSALSRQSLPWSGKFVVPAKWQWQQEEDLRQGGVEAGPRAAAPGSTG